MKTRKCVLQSSSRALLSVVFRSESCRRISSICGRKESEKLTHSCKLCPFLPAAGSCSSWNCGMKWSLPTESLHRRHFSNPDRHVFELVQWLLGGATSLFCMIQLYNATVTAAIKTDFWIPWALYELILTPELPVCRGVWLGAEKGNTTRPLVSICNGSAWSKVS